MCFDYQTYLRDNLLPKIDRATMLVSLEARAPYLDGDLTAFAFSLPGQFKVRGLTTKWILKRAARRWLPPAVIRRRKHGLSVPISDLINGTLRKEVDRLLAPQRLRTQGLLNPNVVGQLLLEHRGGRFDVARGIWALVVLERWWEEWT
jgi:asparagine synthase (glutamine-hydrolysing)